MSDTKGFWGGVAATPHGVAGEELSLRATPLATPPLLHQYREVISSLRAIYIAIPRKSGRASKGPKFLAVAECQEEGTGAYGIVGSNETKGKRWACKTCLGYMKPVWSDGPLPDDEAIEQEYADWMAHGNREVKTWA